jgi:hypothetical protein
MTKYEIHLPLNYTDGERIEKERIKSARDELLAVFGSFAVPNRRTWKYDGSRYVKILKIEVVTPQKVVAKRLKDLKSHLEETLQLSDILVTAHAIQVI